MRALVDQGAHVAFGDVLRDEGEALAAELDNAYFFPLDLTDPHSITQFVEQSAAKLGGIDGLVNNAAITHSGGKHADELTPETWDAVMNVNVRGAWLASGACLPHLKASGRGAIVNIASDTAVGHAQTPRLRREQGRRV